MESIATALKREGLPFLPRGRYHLVVILQPHRRLPGDLQQHLLKSFATVTDELYQVDTSCYWSSLPDFFDGVHGVWLAFLGEELVGFSVARNFHEGGERVLYIDEMDLRPAARPVMGQITLGALLTLEMGRAAAPWWRPMSFVFHTQNPNVYRLAFSMQPDSVAPRLRGGQPRDPGRSQRVLTAMAARILPGREYDLQTSVIKRAYPCRLYGRPLSKAGSEASGLARYWAEHVDVDAGDAVLIAQCLTAAEYRAHLWKYFLLRCADRWRRLRGRAPTPAAAADGV
ncbi:hypothetical protein [Xanthomonas fragariae]|uniref:hypothetical protein n=1 Tax=Xanthomonas fragariae TaxID=48664 RepID=UPI001ABE3D7E|nr:hypothetical protein [Xanthomonas fragariae]UKR52555.1 hypothetical protein K4A87_18975 [Xanthomonas fragariae]